VSERKVAFRENALLGIIDGVKDQMIETGKTMKILSARQNDLKGKIANINDQVEATMGIIPGKVDQIANSCKEQ
jgi:hypothetical protein